jgi:dynein light intermediate chain 1, cytosolic
MAISDNRMSTFTQPSNSNDQERPRSGDGKKKDLWSSMLDSVASGKRLPEKNILVLGKSSWQEKAKTLLTCYPGGSSDSQKEFLEALSVDSTVKRGLDRHGSRQPPVANSFALGYTYYDVPDTDHEGFIRKQG